MQSEFPRFFAYTAVRSNKTLKQYTNYCEYIFALGHEAKGKHSAIHIKRIDLRMLEKVLENTKK